MNTRPQTIDALNHTLQSPPASVYALHPDWIRTANERFVLDPGLPDVRNWITGVVAEIVKNYEVDGIQFDDYFYYETPQSPLDDEKTYRAYGKGFADKAARRRDNTLQLIKQVSATVRALKPAVAFGVSPAGVWRNGRTILTARRRGPARHRTIRPMPIRVSGSNWGCSITSRRSCIGLLIVKLSATTCWPTGGPRW